MRLTMFAWKPDDDIVVKLPLLPVGDAVPPAMAPRQLCQEVSENKMVRQ